MAKIDQDKINKILQGSPKESAQLEVSYDDIDGFGSKDDVVAMFKNIAKYNSMLKERITFINATITAAIPFTKENLYLICGYSGNGKSTIAANVSYPLWQEGKKSLVITNEESKEDVYFRIACLHLGYNFNEYKKGLMPVTRQRECLALIPNIAAFVKVADVNFKVGKVENATATVEGVKALMSSIKNSDYSCVMLDYYQLIKRSVERPDTGSYEVLNDFRIWLGQFIKRAEIPVVVFAQLHSLGKRNNKDLDNRIKHCPDIYEPSTVVIEVIPNFEEKTSDFLIHKDRFGLAGTRIACAFEKGRYVNISEETLAKLRDEKVSDLKNLIDGEESENKDE
jgi:energy-coupling factor transporter ATP-binding protein EcfA2